MQAQNQHPTNGSWHFDEASTLHVGYLKQWSPNTTVRKGVTKSFADFYHAAMIAAHTVDVDGLVVRNVLPEVEGNGRKRLYSVRFMNGGRAMRTAPHSSPFMALYLFEQMIAQYVSHVAVDELIALVR